MNATMTKNNMAGGINLTNPVAKHVLKTNETSTDCVTRKGVYGYASMFLATMLISVIAAMTFFPRLITETTEGINFSMAGLLVLSGSFLAAIIFSIAASFVKGLTVPFGIISCAGYGISLGATAQIIPEYRAAMMMALIITIAITAVLILLYKAGKIRVTSKFRKISTILFWTMVAGSLAMVICCLVPIPGLNAIPAFFHGNPFLAIGGSVIGIAIASMFLISDFDSAENAIEAQISKKYEATLGFSLAFSVIWLYMKVLHLIFELQRRSK